MEFGDQKATGSPGKESGGEGSAEDFGTFVIRHKGP